MRNESSSRQNLNIITIVQDQQLHWYWWSFFDVLDCFQIRVFRFANPTCQLGFCLIRSTCVDVVIRMMKDETWYFWWHVADEVEDDTHDISYSSASSDLNRHVQKSHWINRVRKYIVDSSMSCDTKIKIIILICSRHGSKIAHINVDTDDDDDDHVGYVITLPWMSSRSKVIRSDLILVVIFELMIAEKASTALLWNFIASLHLFRRTAQRYTETSLRCHGALVWCDAIFKSNISRGPPCIPWYLICSLSSTISVDSQISYSQVLRTELLSSILTLQY